MGFVRFNEVRWFLRGSMGSMWFKVVCRGFFEIHLGSVRFNGVFGG